MHTPVKWLTLRYRKYSEATRCSHSLLKKVTTVSGKEAIHSMAFLNNDGHTSLFRYAYRLLFYYFIFLCLNQTSSQFNYRFTIAYV